MNYLRVKNWTAHQHYKDGRPVHWIKLHLTALEDYDIGSLPELAQLHLYKIWMLAGKLENRIPNDPRWVGQRIGAQSEVNLNQLITAGFLLPYETVRECTASYETETANISAPLLREEERIEEERREEKEKAGARKDFFAFCQQNEAGAEAADWESVLKKKKAAMTDSAWARRLNKLQILAVNEAPKTIISRSADSGWTDLYERNDQTHGSRQRALRENSDERRARDADEHRRRILAG